MVIPNADLVTSQVTNWTLTNRLVRLPYSGGSGLWFRRIPGDGNADGMCQGKRYSGRQTPEPRLLFMGFGESSLDFELRA